MVHVKYKHMLSLILGKKFQKISVSYTAYDKQTESIVSDTIEILCSDPELAIIEAIKLITKYDKSPIRFTGKIDRQYVVLSAEIVE